MPGCPFAFVWFRVAVAGLVLVMANRCAGQPAPGSNSFVNFETAPVHPLALSPDRSTLVACNLADGKLEVFDVSSAHPVLLGSVAVGIDPVSVRFRDANEAWVA